MDLRLNGLNPLSYQGVNAVSPSQFYSRPFAPTPNDWQNFIIGALWLYTNQAVKPQTQQVFMLVSLVGNVAKWVELTNGNGTVVSTTGNDSIVVFPNANGTINVVGDGTYITVTGDFATSTETISLINGGTFATSFAADSGTAVPISGFLNIVTGNSANHSGSSVLFTGTSDTVEFNVTDSLDNTMIGKSSGRLAVTGSNNSAFGFGSQNGITSGSGNCSLGQSSLFSNQTSSDNCAFGLGALTSFVGTGTTGNVALGTGSLDNLLSGNFNTAIGYLSAANYTGSESNNILLNHFGVLGESAVIRIGTVGTQTTNFQAGIAGVTVTNENLVTINTVTGQLGSTSATASSPTIITSFSTPGTTTWTKNASTKWVDVYIWGGGGGGGSGAQGLTASAGGGGGGGGGGQIYITGPATLFNASGETVVVGAGGLGGTSQASTTTAGIAGGIPTISSLGNIATTVGSAAGGGSLINLVSGGSGGTGAILTTGMSGGNGNTGTVTTGSTAVAKIGMMGTGGGGGGSGANSVTAQQAGNGALLAYIVSSIPLIAGGTGGISTGTINGGNGNPGAASNIDIYFGGSGGGGGGGMVAGTAGTGGNGGFPGGGGGGGGGSINGTNSGAGGNGGSGLVVVVEHL